MSNGYSQDRSYSSSCYKMYCWYRCYNRFHKGSKHLNSPHLVCSILSCTLSMFELWMSSTCRIHNQNHTSYKLWMCCVWHILPGNFDRMKVKCMWYNPLDMSSMMTH